MLSFFLPALNKSINLYLEITKVLNIITSINISPKYKDVFIAALVENTKLNFDTFTSNSFDVNKDNP